MGETRMEGKNDFLAKAVCLFMNMDKMVGGQFEQGLAQMKSSWKQRPRSSVATSNPQIVEFYYTTP